MVEMNSGGKEAVRYKSVTPVIYYRVQEYSLLSQISVSDVAEHYVQSPRTTTEMFP